MCETKRMLYTCGHEGTHLLIRSCDTGFDWQTARCTVQREWVAGWYERNERCQRCRNRNRPRVGGGLRTKDAGRRGLEGRRLGESCGSVGSCGNRDRSGGNGSARSGSIQSGSNQGGSTRSESAQGRSTRESTRESIQSGSTRSESIQSGSTRSGSTRSGSTRSGNTRNESTRSRRSSLWDNDTLIDSEKNETKSQSSGRTRKLRHEESWDCETLEISETNEKESRSSRSTRLPKIEECPEPFKAADEKAAYERAAYEKKKNHRESLRRLEGRSGRRSGVDKHNRAWEYRVRTGELEAESDSCLLM